ncbi:MAG: DNA polymerase/3'-5' exonuclease PolX [Thermoplasmatales archaeon]|nr:DNA polymerase/3'-5' exonuclease PolX [Thermoplasmatales archaeon]
MKNPEIAKFFYEIANILEAQDVQFKPMAYRKAAMVIETWNAEVGEIYKEKGVKGLKELPGVGDAIAKKTVEILETGKLKYLEELRKDSPRELLDIVSLYDIGPKTAYKIYKMLGVNTVEDLKKAAEEHKIRDVKGLGEKTEEKIIEGIKKMKERKGRMLLGVVYPVAVDVVESLKKSGDIEKISIAGSLRRKKETIGDIDILAVSDNPEKIMSSFAGLENVKKILVKGRTKTSVMIGDIHADLRVVSRGSFGSALQYFTGSKEHNIKIRKIASDKGMKISEYGVFDRKTNKQIAGSTEEEVYNALSMSYIEPELREDRGEIEEAMKNKLPKLIDEKDIKGDFHVHTRWSDGANSIEEMARAGIKKGYSFIAVADHSKSLRVAGGLKENDVLKQMDEIKKINKKYPNFKIFTGTEADIKENGELDFDDTLLKKLDVVVAGVHSKLKMDEKAMTERIINAMENKNVDIIAHPTGRVIGKREPYRLNMEKIFEAAFQNKTCLEINALPDRLDLNDVHIKMAKEKGVKLCINTDAHNLSHFDMMKYGVFNARRGWLTKNDVLNTYPADDIAYFFAK